MCNRNLVEFRAMKCQKVIISSHNHPNIIAFFCCDTEYILRDYRFVSGIYNFNNFFSKNIDQALEKKSNYMTKDS